MSTEIKVGEVRDYFEPLVDGQFPSQAMEVIEVTDEEVFYLPAGVDRSKLPNGYRLHSTRKNFLEWYPIPRAAA